MTATHEGKCGRGGLRANAMRHAKEGGREMRVPLGICLAGCFILGQASTTRRRSQCQPTRKMSTSHAADIG